MISKDKQYRTRDGREVRIYATDGAGDQPIQGAVLNQSGWLLNCWSSNGFWHATHPSERDLIEVKPRHKRTVWLNVYVDEATSVHRSKESADMNNLFRIACIRVDLDFEEGEGLI